LSILLAVEGTAGCGKGYTTHIHHTAGGGRRYTLHIQAAGVGGGERDTHCTFKRSNYLRRHLCFLVEIKHLLSGEC
jgi:hypothetical protein